MKPASPCPTWATHLALRQEDFSPAQWAQFIAHLRTCSTCASRRAAYGVLIAELRLLPSPETHNPLSAPKQWPQERLEAADVGTSPEFQETEDTLQQARMLFSLSHYEKVISRLETFLVLHADSREGWRMQAQACYLVGRYQEAIMVCEAALKRCAGTPLLWVIKCKSLLVLRNYQAALIACEQASQAYAGSAELWQIQACAFFFWDQQEEQQEAEENLLQSDPNYIVDYSAVDLWIDRVSIRCQREPGRYTHVLEACDQALRLDPQIKTAWEMKGRTLAALGFFEQAQDTCTQSLSLDSSDAEEWRFLGYVCRRLGQYEKAREACKRAAELDPQREEVWGLRAAALFS